METTKIKWQSIVRGLLTAIGSFLVGKNIFGHDVDASLWQEIAGIVMAVVSTVWGIRDKTAGVEMIQSTIRQVLTFAGGFLIAAGYITGNNLEAILALIPVILPIVQSHLSRAKTNQIVTGKISTQELKK